MYIQLEGIYLAVIDAKVATRFNISDLSTIGQEYPANSLSMVALTGWERSALIIPSTSTSSED